MLKYVDVLVTFSEIPDEISLAINISNCPCHCEGCHSAYLAEDIGNILNEQSLSNLIFANKGVSCVLFMGGDSNQKEVIQLASMVKHNFKLKTGWYSGRDNLPDLPFHQSLDYIKIGHYDKDRGPLNNPNTNQRLYEIDLYKLVDITNKFWKHDI